MDRHHVWAGAAVCVSLLGSATGRPADAPLQPTPMVRAQPSTPARRELQTRLDRLAGDLHRRGLFDGAIVVGRGAEVVWENGYGYADAAKKIPFGVDTPTDGGSLAKTFTAALVLDLQAEGRLQLDDAVTAWLPELPYPTVTWRHLLSHSSGLPVRDYDYFDPWLPPGRVRTTDMLLAVLAAQRPPLAFTPGTAFDYSSFGFDLAALAAARLTRRSYAEQLSVRIFHPLALASAFVRPGRLRDFPGHRTKGYRRAGRRLVSHDVFDFEGFHGGSNIYLSARDLHRWNVAFMEAGTVAARVRGEALRPARIGDAVSGLTLGSWYRSSDASSFWYSGHLQGFHDEVFRDERTGWSIVYVSNNTLELWLQKALVRAIRASIEGGTDAPVVAPALRAITRDTSRQLLGSWLMSDGERLTVEPSGSHLTLRWNGVGYRMVLIGRDAFYVPGADMIVGLSRGDGPARLYVSTNVEARWGARARSD